MMDKKQNCLSKKTNSVKSTNVRSKSNLTTKDGSSTGGLSNFSSNITLERNGSMPNLNLTGNRTRIDRTTKLRFSYDSYLCSLAVKCALQKNKKKITSNISEQKNVFKEEFNVLKEQLENLSEELAVINDLKIEKKNLDKQIEILEILNKTIDFNDTEKEIMALFTDTASKVVVKNFKKMDEAELNSVQMLLNEIIEPLKLLDYKNQTNARIQLKDLLIKVTLLTKELDKYKIKCEDLFEEREKLQNYNSSLKILKAQFGENPDTTLLPNKSNIMEDIEKLFNEME